MSEKQEESAPPARAGLAVAALVAAATLGIGFFIGRGTAPVVKASHEPAAAPAPSGTWVPIPAGDIIPAGPRSAAACDEVQKLLEKKQTADAVQKMHSCEAGPRFTAFVKVIDEQVIATLNEKGCEAKDLIRAASRVGARSARQLYIDKGCK